MLPQLSLHKNIVILIYNRHTNAFSLVELSIVLVILGLLVGGILAGQSLIRASELRAVTAEQSRYRTAAQAFRDKYFGLPGDLTNATMIWGKDNATCSTQTGTISTPGTCNGDGDGTVEGWDGTSTWIPETYRFWQQLTLAGLIEGNYTGRVVLNNNFEPNVNVPASKLSGGAWTAYDAVGLSNAGNILYIAKYVPNTGNTPSAAILKPEEAWNIDTKLDDGMPAIGMVRAANGGSSITCRSSTGATSIYYLNEPGIQCRLLFVNQY